MTDEKGNLAIAMIGITFVVLIGVGAYYLGTQQNNINSTQTYAPTPTQKPDSKANSVPNDWTFKPSTDCGVKFPVPPNQEPYFELLEDPYTHQTTQDPKNRRYWQLRESREAADGHKIFTKASDLLYVAEIEASGYVAGLVGVQCAPNNSYTLANIAESYAAGFGSDAGIQVKSQRVTNLWGKEVVAAKFEGGMFSEMEVYFVVTKDKIYKVDKRADSDKEFVKNTTDQIFNNLQFPN